MEPDRGFDGPWLAILAVAVVGWTILFAVNRLLLDPVTPAGAGVEFVYAYLLAPLATATILLDALSLRDDGVVDLGLFKWLYALVALVYPVVAVVYYAHREWLKPGDPDLLEEPAP
ncbi:hypothetical protein [Halorubrum gandharaense]